MGMGTAQTAAKLILFSSQQKGTFGVLPFLPGTFPFDPHSGENISAAEKVVGGFAF